MEKLLVVNEFIEREVGIIGGQVLLENWINVGKLEGTRGYPKVISFYTQHCE